MSGRPELVLFNTLTRRAEPFAPLDPPRVRAYSCGPTVYAPPHLGNFRFFVWVDVLHRVLVEWGYDVTLVMNLTDVDDKTIRGAREAGVGLREFTERYARSFFAGLQALRVKPASRYPRATEHVAEMIELIDRLLAAGHAYRADGNVFFDVASFPRYGRLARLEPEQMRATARVEEDAFGKRDPRDFALWKAAKEGEPAWESPFGPGRPGWHLECSAMSMKYLGETFDLHLGGADLIFPHHENEIAQSEAATGRPFARTWLHCAHLLVDGAKMSKSLGNFHTLEELLDGGSDPLALRYLLASVHYRRPLNFTFEALAQAAAAVQRLQELVLRLEQAAPGLPAAGPDEGEEFAPLRSARRAFLQALADDLNVAAALGSSFTLVRDTHAALDRGELTAAAAEAVLAWLRRSDRVFAVLPEPAEIREVRWRVGGRTIVGVGPRIPAAMQERIRRRALARLEGDFATADELRDQLAAAGVELEDTPEGVRWRHRGASG